MDRSRRKLIVSIMTVVMMVFTVIPAMGTGAYFVYADSASETATFSESGVQSFSLDEMTASDSLVVVIKNTSANKMTLKIETDAEKSGIVSRVPDVYYDGAKIATDRYDYTYYSAYDFEEELAAGASSTLKIYFAYGFSGSGTASVDVKITAIEQKSYDVSYDESAPIVVKNGDTVYGPSDNRYKFYKFTLDEPAEVTINTTGGTEDTYYRINGGAIKLTGTNGDNYFSDYRTATFQLRAGTYELDIEEYGMGGDYNVEWSMSFDFDYYDWPAIDLKWTGTTTQPASGKSYAIKASIPANADGVKIDSWMLTTDNEGNPYVMDLSFSDTYNVPSQQAAGWYKLIIYLRHPVYGLKACEYDFCIKPRAAANVTLSSFKSNKSSITVSKLNSAGYSAPNYIVQIRKYGTTAWTNKKVVAASASYTGLKANTKYQVRVAPYVPAANGKTALTGPYKIFTVKTASTVKPVISSVKISGAKQSYVKKVYHAGHWDAGGVWHNAYYTGGYYKTTYKVTVTLKSKLSGTTGLEVSSGGTLVKKAGTGKTFTFYVTQKGKKKGTSVKVKVRSYQNAKYNGYGPFSAVKSVKVR